MDNRYYKLLRLDVHIKEKGCTQDRTCYTVKCDKMSQCKTVTKRINALQKFHPHKLRSSVLLILQ